MILLPPGVESTLPVASATGAGDIGEAAKKNRSRESQARCVTGEGKAKVERRAGAEVERSQI